VDVPVRAECVDDDLGSGIVADRGLVFGAAR
jgi:hypothetical protein